MYPHFSVFVAAIAKEMRLKSDNVADPVKFTKYYTVCPLGGLFIQVPMYMYSMYPLLCCALYAC